MDQEKTDQLVKRMEKICKAMEAAQTLVNPFMTTNTTSGATSSAFYERSEEREERHTKAIEKQSEAYITAKEQEDETHRRRLYLINLEIQKIKLEISAKGATPIEEGCA